MLCSSVGQRPAAALGVPRDWLLFSLSSCSVSVAGRPNAAAPTTAQTAAPIADARAMVAGAAGAGLAVTFRSAIFAIVVVAGAARSTPTAVASAKIAVAVRNAAVQRVASRHATISTQPLLKCQRCWCDACGSGVAVDAPELSESLGVNIREVDILCAEFQEDRSL